MRTREEIENEIGPIEKGGTTLHLVSRAERIIIETLLDIRDLLKEKR